MYKIQFKEDCLDIIISLEVDVDGGCSRIFYYQSICCDKHNSNYRDSNNNFVLNTFLKFSIIDMWSGQVRCFINVLYGNRESN